MGNVQDPFAFLLDSGLSVEDIQKLQRDGIPLDEAARSAKAILDRGEAVTDNDNEDRPFVHLSNVQDGELREWTPPEPLEPDQTPLISFPTGCLPKAVADFVEALSTFTQTDPAMAGPLALTVLATCCQSRYTVQARNGWTEPTCIYVIAIARPGERKSAVFSALTDPIYEFEREKQIIDAVEVGRNKAELEMLELELKKAKEAAANGKASRDHALELADELSQFEQLYPCRLIVDDVTPEKLGSLMEQQHGCMTLASAEGGIVGLMNGRYSQAPNIDVFLKGHSGDPLTVDRVGRAPVRIATPRLSMGLAIQPSVVEELLANPVLTGRGLTARFLYSVCPSLLGHREINPPSISDESKLKYHELVYRLLASEWNGILHLSEDADKIRTTFQAYIEGKLDQNTGEWCFMSSWASKLTGAALRIAGLLHVAETIGDPTQIPISADTMVRATGIASYFASHAERVFHQSGTNAASKDATFILKKLRNNENNPISRRDLFRDCRSRFKNPDEMDNGLQILQEHKYIQVSVTSNRGRPSQKIHLNPLDSGQ